MSIRVGLSAIKNVGDIAIDLIIKERDEHGPYQSFYDFCLRANGQKVNKRVLESLVKVGAFDQFGERNAILASIDEVRNKCGKLNDKKNSGQSGLFDTSETSSTVPKDAFPTVTPMSEKEKLSWEKTLLGIYVTENPTVKILSSFQGAYLLKLNEIVHKNTNDTVKFDAVLHKFKVIHTKKNNDAMAFLTFDDGTGQIEGVIFPKAYENYKNILGENKGFYVEGKISVRDDVKSVLVDSISETLPENVTKYDFTIEVPQGTTQSQLMTLNQLLKNNQNGHRGLGPHHDIALRIANECDSYPNATRVPSRFEADRIGIQLRIDGQRLTVSDRLSTILSVLFIAGRLNRTPGQLAGVLPFNTYSQNRRMDAMNDEAATKSPCLVTVAGPPTSGKTSVLRHALRHLTQRGVRIGVAKFDCLVTSDAQAFREDGLGEFRHTNSAIIVQGFGGVGRRLGVHNAEESGAEKGGKEECGCCFHRVVCRKHGSTPLA